MRDLPTGTVTFFFTDIEGSTRLLAELRESYADALADYRRLLRAAVTDACGHEVDTQGDALFVVFWRASEAVQAAVAAQRALAAHAWPRGRSFRARIGLHTGEPVLAATGYVGLDVHRAARICAAAHAGQVLLSQSTRELIQDELPEGVALRDLGDHRLKDLTRPQRLFQLVVEGLSSEFPPLRTLDNRPTNLPVLATPFLGRERALKEAGALLGREDVRLLTLTGAGGTGKTRVGLQVAADAIEDFAAGVFFVGLAPVGDPELIVPTIAQALGLRETGGQTLRQSLVAYLQGKRLLLVLDNFEQLREGAAILSSLRADCPELKLLVTSRAPLRLSGEQEYPVPPLLLPDPNGVPEMRLLSQYEAVALFIERAQAVKSEFALTEDNATAVLEICRRLDGLPLAIELAAARIKVLSPQAILDRLGERLRLLTGGARDLPARQQTLRDTLDWSHELLEPVERTLFARLAVFVGGRDLQTIEAVCDPDGDLGIDLLDGLTALIDNNLLQHEETDTGEPRFLMLETIHEYAHERLEEGGEGETLRRRHAEHFLALAEEAESKLRGEEQVAWLDRLERERDNIRTALVWAAGAGEAELELRLAGALRVFWRVRGYLTEGRTALEDALARADGQPPTLRAPALYGAAVLALRQGDHASARALSDESLALYRALGDKRGSARALHVLGSVAMGERRYDEARALFEESEPLTRELGDLHLLGITVLDLGDVALNQGAHERAARLFEDSLAVFREIADIDGTAIALYNLGSVALHLGQIDRAPALFAESLGLFRELGYREGIAYSLEGLAAIAAEHGDAEEAAAVLGAADALREATAAALEPAERDRHNRTVEAARAQLGDEAFGEAWERGRAMDPDAAAEYALRISA